jgi:hypothetical protein
MSKELEIIEMYKTHHRSFRITIKYEDIDDYYNSTTEKVFKNVCLWGGPDGYDIKEKTISYEMDALIMPWIKKRFSMYISDKLL